MEFVKEYAAGPDFPTEISYSCFFGTACECYAIAAQRKQLYRCRDGVTTAVNLFREYVKIVTNPNGTDFFAYTQFSACKEIAVYHLDCHFKELDCLKVKKLGGSFRVVDLWFDGAQDFLFLVYPKAILKYNCNGDYLGVFMSAASETVYCSMCTFGNLLFLAYKRNNCPHVGLYCSDGSFREQISLGREYQFLGMQVITDEKNSFLRLHVMKKCEISLFCKINFQNDDITNNNTDISCLVNTCTAKVCPDNTCSANACSTKACPVTCLVNEEEGVKSEEFEMEIVLDDGIGETTCHIAPKCHTFHKST